MKKYIFLILGLMAFVLGGIGIFLPILPTTPFLLMASYCFARGSERMNRWFKNTKIYRNHLKTFAQNKSLTLKTKLWILLPVTALLLIAFIAMSNRVGRIFICLLLVMKYYYFLFKIKTIKNTSQEEKSLD